jgi:DNA-3-methyladenine glycosylase II
METFTLVPRGPFSLTASIKFLEGFTPAWYSSAPDGVLELAFPAEGSWRTAGVRVSQAGEKVEAAIVRSGSPVSTRSPAWPGASRNGSGRWPGPLSTGSSTPPGCAPCRSPTRWRT